MDLDIAHGEMVAIMGPSGSGKSTPMHILGLLHSADRDGGSAAAELRIVGDEVTGLSDRRRTRLRADAMGFVFQAYNLVPTLTALENVSLAGRSTPGCARKAKSAAMEALGWVGRRSATTTVRWSSPAASSSVVARSLRQCAHAAAGGRA